MSALVILAVLAACAAAEPPNPVDGLIVELGRDTLIIRTAEGDSYAFANADPSVPLEHLRVHEREDLPVRITWRASDGVREATTIADAPAR